MSARVSHQSVACRCTEGNLPAERFEDTSRAAPTNDGSANLVSPVALVASSSTHSPSSPPTMSAPRRRCSVHPRKRPSASSMDLPTSLALRAFGTDRGPRPDHLKTTSFLDPLALHHCIHQRNPLAICEWQAATITSPLSKPAMTSEVPNAPASASCTTSTLRRQRPTQLTSLRKCRTTFRDIFGKCSPHSPLSIRLILLGHTASQQGFHRS